MTDPTGATSPKSVEGEAIRVAVAHERAKAGERIAALGREVAELRDEVQRIKGLRYSDHREHVAEVERLHAKVYDCPHAEVCKTCPCADEDDVCFPGEQLRAEIEQLRAELAHYKHGLTHEDIERIGRERDQAHALLRRVRDELRELAGTDLGDTTVWQDRMHDMAAALDGAA